MVRLWSINTTWKPRPSPPLKNQFLELIEKYRERDSEKMSYYNQQQAPVGVPPPQGYPPKDAYPPPGYPSQGYPQQEYPPPQGYPQQGYPQQGYAPQYAQQPPPRKESAGLLEGCECCCMTHFAVVAFWTRASDGNLDDLIFDDSITIALGWGKKIFRRLANNALTLGGYKRSVLSKAPLLVISSNQLVRVAGRKAQLEISRSLITFPGDHLGGKPTSRRWKVEIYFHHP
ncbi:Cysteine-rich and transmembrane domain-containing protein A [Prunus dulcis]|uniref:Cysteine-rich and transmembrane domain-containing protein A n=1 Tax=Prunus dulcis TaxID=3755 RepID=A0A4Y1RPW7_PRUDU|nr:Cysteine-rich and transmembrane domain-containing protein A [Prunus dulcis]